MFYITVKVSSSVEQGDVLNWNDTNNQWEVGSDISNTFGISRENAYSLDNGLNYISKVSFAGQVLAKAGASIPDMGGKLSVSNGKVVVDTNAVHEVGFVAPVGYQENARLENDLITVHIR